MSKPKSIKAEILEFLTERVGYQRDVMNKSRKYDRYVLPDGGARIMPEFFDAPIYVGHSGAFRKGRTVGETHSITDDLRKMLSIPAYGDSQVYYRQGNLLSN
jgi:hypothetical protein